MLNDLLNEMVALVQPPSDKGRRLKIFYMTQASVKPPVFIVFVNDAELMHYSYLRYMENQLRKSFGFEGTPIRFITRQRDSEK
jgi:GTP-binding protein